MKAVPVLLCLALVNGISASIFKQVDSFVDDQLEYIDQLRQHRNQPSENKKQHHYQQVRDEQSDQRRTQEDLQRDDKRIQPRLQPGYKQQPRLHQWDQSGVIKRMGSSEELYSGKPVEPRQYSQQSEESHYRTPVDQTQHKQQSEGSNYRRPVEQPQSSQQSEESYHRTPVEQPRYRQHSEKSNYGSPAEQPRYWQQSKESRYRKPSENSMYRQPNEESRYVLWPEYLVKSEQYQQYQDKAYQQEKDQPSTTQQSQEHDMEQYSTNIQMPDSRNTKNRYRHLTPTLSKENSQESQENSHSKENVKSNSLIDIQKWVRPEKVRGPFEYLNDKKNTYVDVIGKNAAQLTDNTLEYLNDKKNDIEKNVAEVTVGALEYLNDKKNVIEKNAAQMADDAITAVKDTVGIKKIFGDALNAMKHVSNEVKEQLHKSFEIVKEQENDPIVLNATQLAQKYQYPVEEHTIITDDGYELTLIRMPPKKQTRDLRRRPVAFLMHGIDGSAEDWMLMGPGKSLAYMLSDSGFDVWLGNARGNKYSRHHVSKSPALSCFWQYSLDEIALHDLPAMINYVLKTTEQPKLTYIGHSLGATTFFALTAARPEYNDKIKMMYALSPMVYMSHVRSPLIRMISPANGFDLGIGNSLFKLPYDALAALGGALIRRMIGNEQLSTNVNFVMSGVNIADMDPQVINMVLRHLPAGTSTNVIKQYGQGVVSNEFRRYDYGPRINQEVYGSEQPPKYEMEKVQAPVTLYYSEEDWLAHPKDVERLEKELPNVKEAHKVTDEHFSNMDFQFSKKAPEMVYRRVIESMQNNQ